MFNEPNLPGYGWGSRLDDPRSLLARYIDVLVEVSYAIRREDAEAFVILGGLSSNDTLPAEFVLSEIYARGARECFDIVAFHPYGYEGRLTDARDRIRRALDVEGDEGVPIWFDEVGSNVEEKQPQLLRELYSQRSAVEAIFWFALTDFDELDGHYGLLAIDHTRKPLFYTMRDLLRG